MGKKSSTSCVGVGLAFRGKSSVQLLPLCLQVWILLGRHLKITQSRAWYSPWFRFKLSCWIFTLWLLLPRHGTCSWQWPNWDTSIGGWQWRYWWWYTWCILTRVLWLWSLFDIQIHSVFPCLGKGRPRASGRWGKFPLQRPGSRFVLTLAAYQDVPGSFLIICHCGS